MVGSKSYLGKRFGRLLVIKFAGRRHRNALWLCQCDCGVDNKVVAQPDLQCGRTKSCGCLNREQRFQNTRTHGETVGRNQSPEYRAYHNAKSRCTNSRRKDFVDYGGRGIQFRFICFSQFLSCIGRKLSPDLELDRINNNGNYEPGNVRWASHKEQCNNRRPKCAPREGTEETSW